MASIKSKKKHELIKSALGIYLKQRNYTIPRLSPESSELKMMDETIKSEITRANSFSYSNCFCLNNPNNHPGLVDQQFSKISSFIQSQKCAEVRAELQQLLPPLLCHLYVEMLKGQEWKVAIQFLRKHCNIVGQTESSSSFSGKVNGNVEDAGSVNVIPVTFADDPSDGTTVMFRQLITALSTMRAIQDLETDELVVNFRSNKYQVTLSERAVSILKAYLVKYSHVVTLQTLQIWFHIETPEERSHSEETEDEVMEMEESYGTGSNLNGFSGLDDLHETDISKFTNLLASPKIQTPVKTAPVEKEKVEPVKMESLEEEDVRMKSLQNIFERISNTHHHPTKIYCIHNTTGLCSATIDPSGCHVACAFENSSVVLWSASRSSQSGRKPYANVGCKSCEWGLANTRVEQDGISSDEEQEMRMDARQLRLRNYRKFKRKKEEALFMSKRFNQNIIDDTGGYTLRGHAKAVTDVLFSQSSPLLFSTSRDLTMRAWRASDYSCAAIYRGHNYPLWCVAESSTGLYLATGSRDSTARLWSTDREFPLQMYVGHTQDVTSIAFHPNGNYLATGSVDLTVRLWDVTSGKLLRVFTESKLPVYRVAFSPNGKFLASAGEESRARVFDIASGSQLCELKEHPGAVSDIVWNSSSSGLATATSTGVIRMYDLTNLGDQGDEKLTQPSTSSQHPHATLMHQFGTQCKRIARLKLEGDALTCIGND